MSNSFELSVTATSPAIAYQSAGAGEAVLFLHGIGGGKQNWSAQVAALSDRYQAIALDFRGYGDSGDADGDWQFQDLAKDAVRVLDAEGVACAHLVGLSMGGLVAQAVYAAHPERVATLTLAACRPGSAPVEDGVAFASSRLEHLSRPDPMVSLANAMLARLCGPGASPAIHAAIRSSMLALRAENYARVVQLRTSLVPFLDLGQVSVPTLVLAGALDPLAPVSQMASLAAAIPASELHVVEDSGHFINLERADEFTEILRGFLHRHPHTQP